MNQRLNDLYLRRGRLLERIAIQRNLLDQAVEPVQAALYTTDRLLTRIHAAIDYLKAHPGIVALGVAALFIIKPRRSFRWSIRAFSAWQTWRLWHDRLMIP